MLQLFILPPLQPSLPKQLLLCPKQTEAILKSEETAHNGFCFPQQPQEPLFWPGSQEREPTGLSTGRRDPVCAGGAAPPPSTSPAHPVHPQLGTGALAAAQALLLNLLLPWHCSSTADSPDWLHTTPREQETWEWLPERVWGLIHLGKVRAHKEDCHGTSLQLLTRQPWAGAVHKNPVNAQDVSYDRTLSLERTHSCNSHYNTCTTHNSVSGECAIGGKIKSYIHENLLKQT